MQLDAKLGQTVVADVAGHSALNGAPIPDGATALFTSNDAAVATVPTDPVPVAGGGIVNVPVVLVGVGATDIHVVVTLADASVYEDTAQLTVGEPVAGLVRVALTLRTVTA